MTTAGLDPRVERVFNALDDQDAEAVVAEITDEGVFIETATDETFTRAEFREYLADRIFTAFPDYSVIETKVLTTYNWATVVEYTFQATHEGPLEIGRSKTPPTGNIITLPIVAVITLAEDGITEWRDYVDTQRFAEQLGLD